MSSSSYNDIVKMIRSRGYQRIVFTNGCFDILHAGHMSTLIHAKKLAGPTGAVIVGINDDESVKRLKGQDRPFFNVRDRAWMLLNLRSVDHVVTFSEDTPLEIIQSLRPDVIVKGGDYSSLDVVGKEFALVSIAPYDTECSIKSTSELEAKIRGSHG